ncbi:hypothetical protein SNE40_012250 [Patella caerulea]|uniref:Uncharacterized protein n=1 Tax=Patella caerulea TaxID=87958 RepID=A0AAN8PN00_PATCE
MIRDPRRVKSARPCFQPVVHDVSRYIIHPYISNADDDTLINIMTLVNSQKYTEDSPDRPQSYAGQPSRMSSPVPSPAHAWRSASALPPYQPLFEKPGQIQKRQVQKSAKYRSRLSHGSIRSPMNSGTIKSSLEDLYLVPGNRREDSHRRLQTPYRLSTAGECSPQTPGRYFDTTNGLCSSPRPSRHYLPHCSISRRPFTAKHSAPRVKVQKIKLHKKRDLELTDE